MNKKFTVDIRLTKENGSYTSVALIEDSNGNEIDIIEFENPAMTKSGIMHSTLSKAAKRVAEAGGRSIVVKTNFYPLFTDLTLPRDTFPLTKVTLNRLRKYGIKASKVEIVKDEETPVVR